MVRAWYHDESDEDQRLEHMKQPPEFVELDKLKTLTGVLYWRLNPETYQTDGVLDKIRLDRGYTYEDVIEISPNTLPEYEAKIKIFYTEHLHTDEEIRHIMEGTGYFDIRTIDDAWIRIEVTRGDLVVLPAGAYHRFTMDSSDYIKVTRLFVGEPVWTPHNRPAGDVQECRNIYVENLRRGYPEHF